MQTYYQDFIWGAEIDLPGYVNDLYLLPLLVVMKIICTFAKIILKAQRHGTTLNYNSMSVTELHDSNSIGMYEKLPPDTMRV